MLNNIFHTIIIYNILNNIFNSIFNIEYSIIVVIDNKYLKI